MKILAPVFSVYWRRDGTIMEASLRDDPNRSVEDFIVEQFTGLLDKNGKEIYEGDVIEWKDTYGQPQRMSVFYRSMAELNRACFELPTAYPVTPELEIIGNIHENPDLIESGATSKEK
jgi:hypothetical protein